jgi:hypothetical protein
MIYQPTSTDVTDGSTFTTGSGSLEAPTPSPTGSTYSVPAKAGPGNGSNQSVPSPVTQPVQATTITYPLNLITASGSRYGNQLMALYINTDSTAKSTAKPYNTKVNGLNGIEIPRGYAEGSIINNFNTSQGGNYFQFLRTDASKTTRTSHAIYLPVPMNLTTSSGIQYDDYEFGTEAVKLGFSAVESVLGAAAGAAISKLNITALAAARGNSGLNALKSAADRASTYALNSASAASRMTINPHKQLLFKGVGFREFSFTYNFVARNVDETNAIDYIIRLLRYHMHPDMSSVTDLAFNYPSEFDIAFFDISKTPSLNKYLPTISTCVLQKLDVNYSGGKEFVVHNDGSPVEINVVMAFKEIQIMNKTVLNVFDEYIHTGSLQVQQQ